MKRSSFKRWALLSALVAIISVNAHSQDTEKPAEPKPSWIEVWVFRCVEPASENVERTPTLSFVASSIRGVLRVQEGQLTITENEVAGSDGVARRQLSIQYRGVEDRDDLHQQFSVELDKSQTVYSGTNCAEKRDLSKIQLWTIVTGPAGNQNNLK